jgi:hypothetical protein
MTKLEALITKLYTKLFGEPTVVHYLSGKSTQSKENNNENK